MCTNRSNLRFAPTISWPLFLLAAAWFGSACASVRAPSVDPGPRPVAVAASDAVPQLRSEVARWEGTPHVLGGTGSSGLDCSAFVQNVYADVFDLTLPRTTEEQVELGRRINRSELEPGDLVFFQPEKSRHVGIYLDRGEFAHVSSSQGVMISRLDEPYWRRSYWTSRRLVSFDEAVAEADPKRNSRPVAAPRPAGDRVGW